MKIVVKSDSYKFDKIKGGKTEYTGCNQTIEFIAENKIELMYIKIMGFLLDTGFMSISGTTIHIDTNKNKCPTK